MSRKAFVRNAIHRLTGLYVYRSPPRGTEFYADLRLSLPHLAPRIVFDVGANVGQSTEEYLKAFPEAQIYAFEPVAATAMALRERVGNNPRVVVEQLALGAEAGTAAMEIAEASVASRLDARGNGEKVTVATLDDTCAKCGVERIGFLKIDTEGHDLAVLQGAARMLSAHAIDLVQVEAGMSPDNSRHARFEDMKDLMEQHGYRLFALYEQAREFPTRDQSLRRTNPVFISPVTMAANRG